MDKTWTQKRKSAGRPRILQPDRAAPQHLSIKHFLTQLKANNERILGGTEKAALPGLLSRMFTRKNPPAKRKSPASSVQNRPTQVVLGTAGALAMRSRRGVVQSQPQAEPRFLLKSKRLELTRGRALSTASGYRAHGATLKSKLRYQRPLDCVAEPTEGKRRTLRCSWDESEDDCSSAMEQLVPIYYV